MAQYKLSQEGSKTGNTPGGLKGGSLSTSGGRLATAKINSNAGQVGFTPAPIPNMVEDTTAENAQHFMTSMTEAAFKYEERESAYFAGQAVDAYTDKVAGLYDGTTDANGIPIDGYSSKELGAATISHPAFMEAVENEYIAILENLDPRTRQKAIFEMNSIKTSYTAKAANHRTKQFKLAEEQADYQELQKLQKRMAKEPDAIFVPDAAGMTIKSRAQLHFDTPEEFDKWWSQSIEDVTKATYWAEHNKILQAGGGKYNAAIGAYSKSRDYAVAVAQPELAGDLPTTNAIHAQLDSWFNESVSATNNLQKDQIELDDAIADQEAESVRQVLIGRFLEIQGNPNAKPMTEEEFAASGAHLLPQAPFNDLRKKFFAPVTEISDQAAYTKWSAKTGELTVDEIAGLPLVPNLSTADANFIRDTDAKIKAATNKEAIKAGGVYVKEILFAEGTIDQPLNRLRGKTVAQRRELEQKASEAMTTCLAGASAGFCRRESALMYHQSLPSENSIQQLELDGVVQKILTPIDLMKVELELAKVTRFLNSATGKAKRSNEYKTRYNEHQGKLRAWQEWNVLMRQRADLEATR